MSDLYNKVKVLGRGGQAVVNLFKKKIVNPGDVDDQFAIKTYKVSNPAIHN